MLNVKIIYSKDRFTEVHKNAFDLYNELPKILISEYEQIIITKIQNYEMDKSKD